MNVLIMAAACLTLMSGVVPAQDSDDNDFQTRSMSNGFEVGATSTSPGTPAPPRTGPGPGGRRPITGGGTSGRSHGSGTTTGQRNRIVPLTPEEEFRLVGSQTSAYALCVLGDQAYCPASPTSGGGTTTTGGGTATGTGTGTAGTPGISASDFSVLPVKASKLKTDLGGLGLRNGATNIYADGGTQTLTTEVLGQPVKVRARPIRYSFDYGDGTTPKTTTSPGGPLPQAVLTDSNRAFETDTATSHRYTETGTYYVTVTTTFAGDYQVGSGPWTPIPGSMQNTSNPLTIDIWRTTQLHVSGACKPGQTDAGCDGYVHH